MSENIKKFDSIIIASFLLFVALDAFVWFRVAFGKPPDQSRMYFLDIGQGDAELAVLPGGVTILTDAGPDKTILRELEKIPALSNRYIDIAIISHPQLDHFNGFQYLIEKYRIGTFIFNGRSDAPAVTEWETLVNKIKNAHIPLITLAGRDAIRYGDSRIDFLSPNADFIQSAELNDTGFVELLNSGGLKVLLTADIGFNIEQYLFEHFNPSTHSTIAQGGERSRTTTLRTSIEADILKVPHHGSKFSSSDEFLKKVNPKIAVIEVGAHNRYGHPTLATLGRLASSTSAMIFRTDLNGTVAAILEKGKLKIFTEK